MKVLILGATGYLGSQLCKLYSREAKVLGTYNVTSDNDLQALKWRANDYASLEKIIKAFNPNLVINCVSNYLAN